MQRLLEVLSVRKLEDTESLVLFLLCSVYLDVVRSEMSDNWNHLQSLVESLLLQGVSRAERISTLIQRKPGESDSNDLSLCAIENQPGGRHANDFYDFKRIQITPIPDEIDLSKSSDNTFLPMANGEDGFLLDEPALRMVDRSFRLLREDMVSMLRDNLAKPCPIVFSNVCVEEFELRPQPCAILSFDAPVAVQRMSPLHKKDSGANHDGCRSDL
ncbi:hypothetical protein BVRB_020830 [Beta vulgaris subsp. vulgaris]|uniref:Uncharacterized protein n=1 Tax=Beta vulgaris subsp. vulgaris TaxID=3555 RepID=A0A0J8B0I2_BETVV|nr:hypothetical protein BVRB_020830 [Beta vulgaris subsp. vulgaris]